MNQAVSGAAAQALRWRMLQLAGVQLIYFVRLLILARLLAPEAFGLLAIASIAVSVLMRLSDFGMIPALVQRRDATPAQHDAAWTVGLVRAFVVALTLVLLAPLVARLFGEPAAAPIIQALALRPLIDASVSIGIAKLTRELRFRELALIYVPGAVADIVTAVASAPYIGVWALVAGALAGSAVAAGISYLLAPHRPRFLLDWTAIAPLIHFGRWVLMASIVALAGTFATQLAVSRSLGAAALGLYFLALKVAFLPIEAASSVVGAVAFPMFARLRDDAPGTARAFATLLAGLCLLLVPAYALLYAVAPGLEQALGERWVGTAPVIRILSIAGVTAILGELLVPLLMGRGRADRTFTLEVVQTGVLLAVLVPALALFALQGAALSWLIGNSAALVVAILWTRRMLDGVLAAAGRRLATAAVAAAAGAGIAMAVMDRVDGLIGLVIASFAAMAAAAALMWVSNRLFELRLEEFKVLLFRLRT
ncbi:MAG: oligosaccharide flippase family protein [Steroidobacteraceae bacterium]